MQVPFGDWLHNRPTETRIERKGEDFVPARSNRHTTISLSLDRFADRFEGANRSRIHPRKIYISGLYCEA